MNAIGVFMQIVYWFTWRCRWLNMFDTFCAIILLIYIQGIIFRLIIAFVYMVGMLSFNSSASWKAPREEICDTVADEMGLWRHHLIFNWTRYFDMHNACLVGQPWLEPAGELAEAGLGPSNASSDNVSHFGWCSLQTRARHTSSSSSTNLNMDSASC